MPDNTPEEPLDAVGSETRASRPRRSGLDRLRQTRGETVSIDAPEVTRDDAGVSRASSTALIDTDTAEPNTAEPDTAEPGSAANTDVSDTAIAPTKKQPADDKGRVGTKKLATRRSGAQPDELDFASASKDGPARPVAAATTAGETRATPLVRKRQLIVLGVLILLAIGLLVPVFLLRHRVIATSEENAVKKLDAKRTEAVAAGRRFAITFFSPDYKTIDTYTSQVTSLTTGDFNKDFVGKKGELKSVLTSAQSQATGKVLASGASRVSGDQVEVLVVADQDVKNKLSKGKAVTNRYRVQLTMQQTPKGWLVAGLVPVV